jgi:hypothetical protein
MFSPEERTTMHAENNLRAARIASALLLGLVFLWCLYWFVHAWHYWEDDAYIHLEFARSLASGRGFAFNGRVVAGDTAPLWVFLLAASHILIPDWLVAGKLLTVLGAALGLTGAYAFARRIAAYLLPSGVAATLFPAALLLLIVANPYFCYWAFSGMEPVAASGVAFFAVLAATRDRPSTASFLAASLLAGIAPLLRPEMFFLSALLLIPLIGQGRRLPGNPDSPYNRMALIAGLFLAAAPITLWAFYSLHAFGHLLPNTNAAKRAAPADSVLRHLLSIYSAGFPLILCGLAAGILYLLLRPSAVRRSLHNAVASAFPSLTKPTFATPAQTSSLPLAGWIFLLWPSIATLFYVTNHTYVQTRYILLTAPGLTIVILLLAFAASPRTARILYLAALAAALTVSLVDARPFIRNKIINCQITQDLALYIRDRLPPDAPVAAYAIGQIAFVSQHPILDISGITRPGAVPFLTVPPQAMVHWARSQGAQYYIAGLQPVPGAVIVYPTSDRFAAWTFHTALYSTSTPVNLWKLPASTTPNR